MSVHYTSVIPSGQSFTWAVTLPAISFAVNHLYGGDKQAFERYVDLHPVGKTPAQWIFEKLKWCTDPALRDLLEEEFGAPDKSEPTNEKGWDFSTLDDNGKGLIEWVNQDWVMLLGKSGKFAYHKTADLELNESAFLEYCIKNYGQVTFHPGTKDEQRVNVGQVWWHTKSNDKRVVIDKIMEPTSAAEDHGSDYLNRWYELRKTMVEPNTEATLDDIEPFLSHLMYISDGDTVVVLFFMCWLANLYQHPDIKMPTAILMYSKVGRIGKSMIYKILKQVFGAPLCGTADGSVINSKFMDAFEHKRVVFLNELSRSDKLDSYERFKSLVSEEDTVFEGKGRAAHGIKNFAHYLITTNHEDALPLMEGDGRVAIFRCTAERKDNAYYKMMHGWMEGPGPSALAQVLATWVFPAEWDCHAPVPQTEATRALQQASRPAAVNLVGALIENRQPPFDKDVGQIHTILIQMETTCGYRNMTGINDRSLGKALATLKHTQLGNRTNKAYGAWCWRNHGYWARQENAVWRAYLLQGAVPKDLPASEAADMTNVTSITEGKKS